MKNKLKSLSIIIPCYNEEEVLDSTYETIISLLTKWEKKIISDYEIILVNNWSNDKTLKEMKKLSKLDSKVIILDLRKNYWYQWSITAWLFNATKEMIVSIDADLQDPPEKIEEMIEKHYKWSDLVLWIRKDRKSDSFIKRVFAESYYKVLWLLWVNAVFNHWEFRLMSKEILEDFKKYTEKNRYIRSLILELEPNYSKVYYSRNKRELWESKFWIKSLFSLWLDWITSFTISPIRFISFIWMALFIISIILILWVMYQKVFMWINVSWWTSIIVMLFFFWIQNLSIWIIWEYIWKTYIESKNRPVFLIKQIIKSDEK